MAKDYPPKNQTSIGDPTRTESTVSAIGGAGKWSTFKKDNETFVEMHQRREAVKKPSTPSEPSPSVKQNKPDIYHEAMKKEAEKNTVAQKNVEINKQMDQNKAKTDVNLDKNK
ncbi:MAG: hypothetical protein ACOYLG_01115 [Chitinophagaceae bacterium]